MTKLKLYITFIASLSIYACSRGEQKNSYPNISQDIPNYSKEDSIRIKNYLLPLSLNWQIDSIAYGVRDKSGVWNMIKDTTISTSWIKKIYYSLDDMQGISVRKEVLMSKNDSEIIEEIDFYRRYVDDSSKHIGLFISMDYKRNNLSSMLDTFDYEKQKTIRFEEDKLKRKREAEAKYVQENELEICGTAEVEDFFSRYSSYHNIHYIDTGNIKEVLNKNFVFEEK
jgi:hypothetical protein